MSPAADAAPAGQPARTSLVVIFLVLFVDLVGFSIVFPLYADMLRYYSAHDQGLLKYAMGLVDRAFPGGDPIQRAALFGGLIGAAYSSLQFVSAPYWGRISDRIGRRPVLLFSIGGNTLAYLVWIFAGDFTTLLVSRLLAGLMTGNVATANAAVADITTPQTRARGMGMIGMAFGLGFILGPALGGLSTKLPQLGDSVLLASWGANPFSSAAAIAFLLSLFNLVWAAMRFHETLPPERRGRSVEVSRPINPARLFSRALGATVAVVNFSFFFHTLLFAGFEATMVFLSAQRCQFPPMQNGWLFAWMGLVAAAIQGGVFRRLAPRIGQRPLAIAGFAVMIPGFALIALVDWLPSTALLVVGVTGLAVGTGLVFPSLNTIASLSADPARQGEAMGAFRSAGSLGRALGPLLAAVIYFVLSPAAPYLVAAVGMIVPLVLVARLRGVAVGVQPPGGQERSAAPPG
jgi:MFS family permease